MKAAVNEVLRPDAATEGAAITLPPSRQWSEPH